MSIDIDLESNSDLCSDSPANLFEKFSNGTTENFIKERLPGKVSKKADVAAIILAGGNSSRIRDYIRNFSEKSKTLISISGKPVLTWSMESFDAVEQIGLIVVVCPENEYDYYIKKVVDPFAFKTPVLLAPAGDTRQESAFNGLDMVPDKFDYVMIHDGARPLIPPSTIKHIYSVLKSDPELDGAICAHPCIDTLKVVEDTNIIGTPDRKVFWTAQTPQVFKRDVYQEAHRAAFSDGFICTDDSSLVERIGGQVKVVQGKRNNIKLTVPEDYLIVASVFQSLQLQHGSEYDL